MFAKITLIFTSLAILLALTGGDISFVDIGLVDVAHAQVDTGLEDLGAESGLGTASLQTVIANIIRAVLGFVGILAVLIVIYAGFLWMTAAGNDEKVAKAKRILIQGVIGLVIILMSYGITTFVFTALLGATGAGTGSGGSGGGGGGSGGTGLGGGSIATFAVADFVPEGEVAIRNIEYKITFTRNINEETLDDTVLVITNADTGVVVDGTLDVSGNTITFVPTEICPEPNADRFCFDESSNFNVTVSVRLEDTSGRNLDCSVTDSCESSFTSGVLVDTEDPSVDLIFPDYGDKLEPGVNTLVQVGATDDAQVGVATFFAEDIEFDAVAAAGDDLTDVIIESLWDNTGLDQDQRYTIEVTVSDLAGNEDSDSVSVEINPAHCYNAIQDEDETGLNCGGSCGACEGGICAEDFDCAEGACVEGICTSVPEITGISPTNGAVGTLITISGDNLGATGDVFFTAADGLLVQGATDVCTDGWNQDEILVQVPVGAIDGPILIETNLGRSDATDDDRGPVLADFDVNDVVRPGLCRLSPTSGRSGNSVDLVGSGFDADQNDSAIFFGDVEVVTYADWTDERLEVNIPAQDVGEYDVVVTVNGTDSNAVAFEYLAAFGTGEGSETIPSISFIEPDTGGIGQYVTIVGSNFGAATGQVIFRDNETGYEAVGAIDFPDACTDDFWNTNEITVIVPDSYSNDIALAIVPHDVFVIASDPDLPPSNSFSFSVTTEDPGPGICNIEPDAALAGETVTIYGSGFGSVEGEGIFYNEASASDVISWDDDEITLTVPGATQTGPLRVETDAGDASNTVNFEIGASDSEFAAAGVTGSYSWTFSTGEIPQTPQLVVACNETQVSAVPNQRFSLDVCTNAVVYAEFDMLIDHATLTEGSSVLVELCVDGDCGDTTPISGSLDLSDSASSTSMSWAPNAGNFDVSSTYLVTVTSDVTNTEDPAIALSNDVSWEFTTRDDGEDCLVESVRVSPFTSTLIEKDSTTEFLGLPSGQDDCVVLDANDYTWNWDIDESFASIDEGACAEIVGDHCAVATALAEGEALVTATENFSGESGNAELTIDFTDPYVTDRWPDCGTACIDAEIGMRFNTAMSNDIELRNSVRLLKCSNELCLTFTETVSEYATCIYNDDLECTEVFSNYTGSLEEDSYYRVILSGKVSSTSDVFLTRTNYGSDYSWTFSTKQDNARCSISRIELSPSDVTLEAIGDSQNYTVTAYGEPDECSEAGQRLNAQNYDWAWEDPIIDSVEVAEWLKIDGQLFDANISALADGCTSSCLSTGSSPYAAICGRNGIETGESCDDGNTVDGDGCSSQCLREGGDSIGICGDGILDQDVNSAGESCDDGNLIDGDGCSSQCLNEGSRSIGSICGNANLGYEPTVGGEDCDDGNTVSGDGCSSQCLDEGSASAADVTAICGDGRVETPYETCDDSNIFGGDGCSGQCLREGSDVFGDFGLCGDGRVDQDINGAGEDCDDGNTEDGDGCSSQCLAEGSSVSYSSPSVCGDGQTGTGELVDISLGGAICESGVSPDGEPDPVQVAEIVDTAVDHVDVDLELATTSIRVEEFSSGLSASTTLNLSCVAENELDCPDAYDYGVTTSSCCMVRPTADLYPVGADVCRNAAVYAVFSQRMGTSSFDGNAYLELDTSTTGGVCPDEHEIFAGSFAYAPNNFFGRFVQTLRSMVFGVAQAQEEGACIVPIRSYNQTEMEDGNFKVNYSYGIALAENATYEIVLDVDGDPFDGFVTGVLNSLGVALHDSDGELRQPFTTSAEVCTLDEVEVTDSYSDSPGIFTTPNETHGIVATPYSYAGTGRQEIETLPGVYEWTWASWEEDSSEEIVAIDTEVDNLSDVSSQEQSGDATVVAQAVVTTDTVFGTVDADSGEGATVTGEIEVEAVICNNPWPSFANLPFIDDNSGTEPGTEAGIGWTNFSTWYCRDSGEATFVDDLSATSVVAPPTAGTSDVLKEYLFKISDGSGDAIGFRVLSNEAYLSPLNWYRAQGFGGNPTDLEIDGFEAIQDGRTVYISAPNKVGKFGDLYSNIYVYSYNEGAGTDTINIFNQMMDNLRFATNISDVGLCLTARGTYNTTSCDVYSDCAVSDGETCGNRRSQLRRDNRRLTDLTTIVATLETFGTSSGRCSATVDQVCSSSLDCPSGEVCKAAYPDLAAGSFIRGLGSSAWDSWEETLEDEIGVPLPADPVNSYVDCGAGAYADYDAGTCVNQTAGTYVCPVGSQVYHYRSQGPFSFEVAAELEYDFGRWKNDIDTSDDYDILVGNNTAPFGRVLIPFGFGIPSGSTTGFTTGPAYCDGTTVYGASSSCGDGIVGVNGDGVVEVCEIGQEGAPVSCDLDDTFDTNGDGDPTNDADGTISGICNNSCSGFEDNPSAICVAISCGNGITEVGEDCDDGSFNGRYGFCGNDCSFATSLYCGDDSVAGGESCDCGAGLNGLDYGGGSCTSVNGTYSANPANSCAWDCSGPAAYCGDAIVDAGETCDGNTELYAGELCDDGSDTQCNSDADCNGGATCGGTAVSNACPFTEVCIAGDPDKLGTECFGNGDCDTALGENDGACSTQAFQTTRTKTCADGADGSYSCTWNNDWESVECKAPLNCGNGVINEGEDCDDGNNDNTDSCTNECLANTCGDGFIYAGIEDCDEGDVNGILCSSGYEGSCSYCSDSCRLLGASGAFCGDGEINGGEFCDAGDLPYYYVNADGDTNGTCDPEDVNIESGGYTCTSLGVCNGGDSAGELCSSAGQAFYGCGLEGTCVFPECRNSCASSCPLSFASESLTFEGNLLDSNRQTSITLLDKGRADASAFITEASSATAFVPACTVYDDLILTLDDSQREYPDVEVMFVLDKSATMDAVLGDSTRLAVLQESVTNATQSLYEAYDGISASMKVGIAFIGGVHGENDDGLGAGDGDPGGFILGRDFNFGGGAGADDSCFTAGTQISLADGSTKNIEDVELGDMVLAYNEGNSEQVFAEVLALEAPMSDGYYVINDVLEVTENHPLYINKLDGRVNWGSLNPERTLNEIPFETLLQLEIGDLLLDENENWVSISTLEYVSGDVQTYNLKTVEGVNTFYAEGFLVHNKSYSPPEDVDLGDVPDAGDFEPPVVLNAYNGPFERLFHGVKSFLVPYAMAAYEIFYPPTQNFVYIEPSLVESDVIDVIDANFDAVHGVLGTPIYGSLLEAADAFSGTADEEVIIVFTDGDIWNDRDLGLSGAPNNIDKLSFDYLGQPTDFDDDDNIGNEEYLYAVSGLSDYLTTSGVKIYTAILGGSSCDITQMERWSSLTCDPIAFDDPAYRACSDKQAQGNYSCDTGEDGLQYAYQATTADELEEMYDQIIGSILNYTVSVTFDGETVPTNIPSGTNRTIELPASFACDENNEQGITLTTSFGGDGTLTITSGSLEMCTP